MQNRDPIARRHTGMPRMCGYPAVVFCCQCSRFILCLGIFTRESIRPLQGRTGAPELPGWFPVRDESGGRAPPKLA